MPSSDELYSKIGLIPKSRTNDQISGIRVPPIYVFIFEDGSIGYTPKTPTVFDIRCVEDGIFTILCIEHGKVRQFNGEGNLVELTELTYHSDPSGDYHALKS